MPLFRIKYRTERPEKKRTLTPEQKKLPADVRKAMGLDKPIHVQFGLSQLRKVELAGDDPRAEAKAWADGFEADLVVLDVQSL